MGKEKIKDKGVCLHLNSAAGFTLASQMCYTEASDARMSVLQKLKK